MCQTLIGFILGTGNTRFSFIASLFANIIEFILIILINKTFSVPMIAIGIGISGWYLTNTLMCGIYYFSKSWKKALVKV